MLREYSAVQESLGLKQTPARLMDMIGSQKSKK